MTWTKERIAEARAKLDAIDAERRNILTPSQAKHLYENHLWLLHQLNTVTEELSLALDALETQRTEIRVVIDGANLGQAIEAITKGMDGS